MFSCASTSHVLSRQSRAIVAVVDPERHRFLAGTCCLREENEIHLLEFDEESNTLSAVTVYRHPKEIWSISPSPRDTRELFTTYTTGAPKNPRLARDTGVSASPRVTQDRSTARRYGARASQGPSPRTTTSTPALSAPRAPSLCRSSRSFPNTRRAFDRASNVGNMGGGARAANRDTRSL